MEEATPQAPTPPPRTVKLKVTPSGVLVLATPFAPIGPEASVYAIENVPPDVPAAQVVTHVAKLGLIHPRKDLSAWVYQWRELATLSAGAIVNRHAVTDDAQ